jgi:hypothetical protein
MRPDLTQTITLTDRRWREAEFDGGDMKIGRIYNTISMTWELAVLF